MSTTDPLSLLADRLFITDGGLETTLIFQHGVDLPEFAAFPLLDDPAGRELLEHYLTGYIDIAARSGLGIVLDTPTWRANEDWGGRLGYDRQALDEVNVHATQFIRSLANRHGDVSSLVNGVIGPRGDGYVVGETMTADEATAYHAAQAQSFARAGADMITAVTMTYVDEAIGVARAAADAGLPVVISFTTETDGRLPSGTSLAAAIAEVDHVAPPAYFMVNCAHPTHFVAALDEVGDSDDQHGWLDRIKAIRANASTMSHAELDEAEQLDRGDIDGLAEEYSSLDVLLPDLRVVGGCCGTDEEHIAAIARRVTGGREAGYSSSE